MTSKALLRHAKLLHHSRGFGTTSYIAEEAAQFRGNSKDLSSCPTHEVDAPSSLLECEHRLGDSDSSLAGLSTEEEGTMGRELTGITTHTLTQSTIP